VIEKVIEFSARNKFFILVLTAVALAISFWTLKRQPLDAIPDLSDTQVIVYSKWDRSPDIVEDPISATLMFTLFLKTEPIFIGPGVVFLNT
jgi:Cu(I)/Ag(I) efflux system membrane protein CusA/SilA